MRCAMLVEEHAAFRQALAYLLERHLEVAYARWPICLTHKVVD